MYMCDVCLLLSQVLQGLASQIQEATGMKWKMLNSSRRFFIDNLNLPKGCF